MPYCVLCRLPGSTFHADYPKRKARPVMNAVKIMADRKDTGIIMETGIVKFVKGPQSFKSDESS